MNELTVFKQLDKQIEEQINNICERQVKLYQSASELDKLYKDLGIPSAFKQLMSA